MILARQLAQALDNFQNDKESLLSTLDYYKEKNLILRMHTCESLEVAIAYFCDGSLMHFKFNGRKTEVTAVPKENIQTFLLKQLTEVYKEERRLDENVSDIKTHLNSMGIDLSDPLHGLLKELL